VSGVSADHIVSLVVLLAAILLFIGLFNNTLSVTVNYQRNTSTAKACSDLLDAILLAPSFSTNATPTSFGLQANGLPQYQLDPFAIMRLNSSAGTPVSYQKTSLTYSSMTTSPGNYLLYPYSDAINYSTASNLLGANGTYGFQFQLIPTINISIAEISTSPLSLSLNVTGTSFPLANATVNYYLIPVSLSSSSPSFQTLPNQMGSVQTNNLGSASITFSSFSLSPNLTYAFVAYAYLDGVTGIGYYEHAHTGTKCVVPFVNSISSLNVTLAHSDDVPTTSSGTNTLYYNTTFVLESQGSLLQTYIGTSNQFGSVSSGNGNSPVLLSMGSFTPGILVIAYNNTGNNGVVMMPWGFSSLGFSLTFGNASINPAWVATDFRQVEINGVSYQAKLSLWSEQGYQGAD